MKNDLEENILLEKYINGCNYSLSKIYENYYTLFMKVSKKYLCNKEEAEDLIQNIIERLLCMPKEKRIERFSNVKCIRSYFYSILKYGAIDQIRLKRFSFINLDTISESFENIDLEDKQNLELQYKNIGLSTTEILYFEEYLNGKKPRELAFKFSKSVSTIKNTLNSAKKKIISNYKKYN